MAARTLVGILLSVLLLWLLFRGTEWRVLAATLLRVDIAWLLLAMLLTFSSAFARVQRWSYVVRASHPASFRSLFSATQIGMLVNCMVPAQLGDLVRAYVLSTQARISFTGSLTVVALDRINDVLALLVVLLLALLAFPRNTDIEFAAGAFGNANPFVVSSSLIQPVAIGLTGVLVLIMLVLVFLYFRQNAVLRGLDRVTQPLSPKMAAWLHAMFVNFAEGMHIFRSRMQMARSVLLSLATWGLVALALAALLKAFHLDFPWYGPILMLAILGVFTLVTVTPGLIGQYHIAVVASLLMMLPGINLDEAKAVAITAHLLALLPPIVLGVYCMLDQKLSIRDLVPKGRSMPVD